ncbi:hypothetical protein SDC9_44536 [bioreactor metagenome]|uniref:Uncharacterized protein n=1 Tax=bioreactor metagenome TaxID=1076179 RepID=A0A644W3K6_9ZZZZ|nr:DUF5018 domain-containing protein [Macellibacteroides fermentans]
MKFNKNIGYNLLLALLILCSSCAQDEVAFSNTDYLFNAIQIQKFDYAQRVGVGKIYQGKYSADKDSIYFDVTYFPDEKAPTYQDWVIQGSVFKGAKVVPGLSGVKDLKDPVNVTVYAPDGVTKREVVIVTKIYEIPYGELEKGFGRYNKLWTKSAADLGGWVANAQTSLVVVGDELIVNNDTKGFLVYDKRTGLKKDKTVPVSAGNTSHIFALAVDKNEVLHAVSFINSNTTDIFKIYRWSSGLDKEPEVFCQVSGTDIQTTKNTGMGRSFSICGDTYGDAQLMVALDGYGGAESRIVRIPVVNGVPTQIPDVFEAPNVSWTWRGKGIAASPTGKTPYFALSLGSPQGLVYYDNAGEHKFVTNAANSNFLNKVAVSGACYFEFNHAKYLAASSCSWPGDLRMLIFSVDDPTLIPSNKSENAERYSILNPFCENWEIKSNGNTNGTGDITVQIQKDGKTALVYMLDTNTGIMAYELTNVGSSSK